MVRGLFSDCLFCRRQKIKIRFYIAREKFFGVWHETSTSHTERYTLKRISLGGLLGLYWTSYTLKSSKASSPKIFHEVTGTSGPEYIFGFLVGFLCSGWGGKIEVDDDTLKVTALPDGFQGNVARELDGVISFYNGTEQESKATRIKEACAKIDAYFAE